MNRSKRDILNPTKVIADFLAEDIEVFDQMLKNRKVNSKSYKLINSMLKVKKKLYAYISSDVKFTSKGFLKLFQNSKKLIKQMSLKNFNDESVLAKLICQTEQSQYTYIKKISYDMNLSENISRKLQRIIVAYERIIDQLNNQQYRIKISIS